MSMADEHLKLLGMAAEDKITGYKGVVDSIAFDLYGCIQALLKPKVDKNGEVPGGCWFDVTRLTVFSGAPVVDQPNFHKGYVAEGRKGPSDKTAASQG